MTIATGYRIDHDRIQADTPYVLRREYYSYDLRRGLAGLPTPIFDTLAAERFARDSH